MPTATRLGARLAALAEGQARTDCVVSCCAVAWTAVVARDPQAWSAGLIRRLGAERSVLVADVGCWPAAQPQLLMGSTSFQLPQLAAPRPSDLKTTINQEKN